MFHEFQVVFQDDYIRIGKRKIRPFSLLWWIIRFLQVVCGIGGMYLLYCSLWVLMS